MKKRIQFLFIFISVVSLLLYSCNNSNNNNDNDEQDSVDTSESFDNNTKTFYLVPSPDDIFGFTDDVNLTFKQELLNPVANTNKYNNTKIKEFVFGVYSADLAYSATFDRNKETVQYLTTVRTLSNEINIAGVFNESLSKRIENLSGTNKDSLIAVSSDTYFDIIRYLEKHERINTLAFIAAGGWLESLYLVTQLIEFDENSSTIQRVADQKIIFSNLILYLEQNLEYDGINEILEELAPIKNIYEQLEIVDVEETMKTDDNEAIIVGGKTKIKITELQYKNLKETISNVRNNFINNNVTL